MNMTAALNRGFPNSRYVCTSRRMWMMMMMMCLFSFSQRPLTLTLSTSRLCVHAESCSHTHCSYIHTHTNCSPFQTGRITCELLAAAGHGYILNLSICPALLHSPYDTHKHVFGHTNTHNTISRSLSGSASCVSAAMKRWLPSSA